MSKILWFALGVFVFEVVCIIATLIFIYIQAP